MKIKAIVVGLVSLMAAALTFAKTGGQVFAQSQPQLALTIDPANADAKSRLASMLVAKTNPSAAALDRARALSLQVLRAHPGDSMALRTLGMVEVHEDPERGAAFVEAATRFSKRDTAAHLWLVNYYGIRGQDERALVSLGSALRTSVSSRPLLFPALLKTAEQDQFRSQLVGLLAPRTGWSDAFWSYTAEADALPLGLASLMLGVKTAGGVLPRDAARTIVGRLADNGRITAALSVLAAIEPGVDVREAWVGVQDFGRSTLPPPLGWTVTSSGRIYGEPGTPGELRMDVRTGSEGSIARRLVAMPTGSVAISGSMDVTAGEPADAPSLSISCVDSGRILHLQAPTGRVTSLNAIVTIPSNCPYQWIDVVSPEVRSAAGSSATMTGLTLGRSVAR